ncbi:hypothetical protein CONLIGDRAFT_580786 [Coniochaeta ligniaria NRRL 30616]|uniref:Uncharacterized protein n=1 Tax=Coniochaeta ligniaria NRRL 30616 TaxID=1408157 RepID=A0A1J7JAI3_9PEZI|nr:hypothetical protein CONLIGDRAFT_580786 [Coniochaeta ligniaria NRRL 30616]
MASPAIAAPAQVNGANTTIPLSRSHSPVSISSSTKRKRDDGSAEADARLAGTSADTKSTATVVNGATQKPRDQKALIREYFDILRRYNSDAAILKRPLPDVGQDDGEPDAKRRKSEDDALTTTALSIEDRVLQDGYATLEDILADVTRSAKARIVALKSSTSEQDGGEKADEIRRLVELKDKALDLYRRELAYPSIERLHSTGPEVKDGTSQISTGRALLMTYATINNGKKPLLTSLQKPVGSAGTGDEILREVAGTGLPPGITVTHALGGNSVSEKPGRSRTLGELFPSPRNLPPLQPPKPNKGTTKSNMLTFYHPVLTDQSSYRTGTYFSQTVSTGQWLDYSNATPAAHKKTKQRERAQSLAGVKPSSTELEMSEMEALFRGAFSSFAPCKDDTAAVVSSGQVSRMYWQRYGRRNLQRMMDSEVQVDETEPSETTATADQPLKNNLPDVDEDIIKEVIDTWDEAVIDPTLTEVMGQRPDEDKEVEDILQEVSDLIETLASYQRNRNLTLPTSQDRFSADPPNGDMLRNGALSHQPSEEEMLTYQALKAQLSLIIQTLPPFAVARINSDKLEELSVSTKIEIRTDDFKGAMEEDERALRTRQPTVQSAAPTQRATPHRTPSMSSSVPYPGHHQYGSQYAANARSPMPAPQHYPQTPVRAQPPSLYQRPASAVPLPQPHQAQVRHPSAQPQQYRTQNGYGSLTPQVAKTQPPYGPNVAHFNGGGVAGQARMQPHQGYPSIPQSASPNHRYQQPYTAGYPQQQHPQHQGQQSMHPPQHPGLPQQLSQQRPYSPYVAVHPHSYSQSPTPPQQHQQLSRPPYGTPNQAIPPNGRNYNGGAQGMPPQAQNRGGSVGVTGYATVMGDAQQKQVLEQARQQARLDAQSRASTFGHEASQGNKVAGLAGIGLSGSMDAHRMAAMRAASMGHSNSMSQSPKGPGSQPVRNAVPGGHGLNGGAVLPPPVASSVSPQDSNASPAVSGTSPVP